MRGRLGRWGPLAAWMALIWLLSAQPGDVLSVGWEIPDKLAHAVVYLVLGLLAARAVGPRGSGAAVLGLAAGWGALDELHQRFVPLRQADPRDWLADLVGAACGLGLVRLWRRRGGNDGL